MVRLASDSDGLEDLVISVTIKELDRSTLAPELVKLPIPFRIVRPARTNTSALARFLSQGRYRTQACAVALKWNLKMDYSRTCRPG